MSGQNYYKLGHYQQAIKSFQATLSAQDKDLLPSSYYYLGCCYMQQKNMPQARQYFVYLRDHYSQSKEAALAASVVGSASPSPSPPNNNAPGVAVLGSSGSSPGASSTPSASSRKLLDRPSSAVQRCDAAARPALSPAADLADLPDENRFYFKSPTNEHMEVQAYFNDKPITCIFDTGAGAHFGKNHLREANIPEPVGSPTGITTGWAGKIVAGLANECHDQAWQHEAQDTGNCRGNMTLPPVLGQEFVSGYSYEVDHAGGFVTMKKVLSSAISQSDLYDIPCARLKNRDIITVQVNNKPLQVLLDTGATKTIFDPTQLTDAGITVPEDLPHVEIRGWWRHHHGGDNHADPSGTDQLNVFCIDHAPGWRQCDWAGCLDWTPIHHRRKQAPFAIFPLAKGRCSRKRKPHLLNNRLKSASGSVFFEPGSAFPI